MAEQPMVATWDQFWKRFDVALAALPDELRDAAVDAIQPELAEADAPNTHERVVLDTYGSKRGLVYYAVHDSELAALERFSGTLNAFTKVLISKTPAGPAGMAIGRVVAWYWRYLRQRIELNPWQAIVLRCVKRSGDDGGTIAELVEHLTAEEKMVVDGDDFARELLSMLDIERMDGTRTQLVEQEDGRWWAVDV